MIAPIPSVGCSRGTSQSCTVHGWGQFRAMNNGFATTSRSACMSPRNVRSHLRCAASETASGYSTIRDVERRQWYTTGERKGGTVIPVCTAGVPP